LKATQVYKEGRKLLWNDDYFTWVKDNWYSRGEKLDFDDHKYLIDVYKDQSPFLAFMKSAQVGATERFITETIWLPDQNNENSIYFFPSGGTVSDLVQERIDEPFNSSPYLSRVSGRSKKMMGKQADKVGLKRMSKGFAYFRSGGSTRQITSVAGDMIIVDEVDRIDPKMISYFDKRLEHSKRKWQRWASTPTIPNFGIHKIFLDTDQKHYHVKCNHCNDWQALDFFINVDKENEIIFCSKCKKSIIPWQLEGQWIPKYPEKEKKGFFLTQLYSPRLNLHKMIEDSERSSEWEIQQFYNQNLGLPYEPKGAKLTDTDINNCIGSHSQPQHSNKDYVYMGVDVGKRLHYIVRTKDIIVGIGSVGTFEELADVFKMFNVRGVVLDALPETRKVTEFARKFTKRVKMNYYTGMAEMSDAKKYWKVDGVKVNSNRTIGLDNVFAEFKQSEVGLPVNIDTEFRGHLKSTIRVIEEGKSGQMNVKYIETSDDHYLHACNYAKLAVNIFNVATPEVFVL